MNNADSNKNIKQVLDLAANNRAFELAVKNAFNHIIITDAEGTIVFANAAVERITGYSHIEIIGKTPRLWGGQMRASVYKGMWKTIKKKKHPYKGTLKNKRKNGELYDAKTIITPILDGQGKLVGFIGTEEDISKKTAD